MAGTRKTQLSADDLTTVTIRKRNIVLYPLHEQEIDTLIKGYTSQNFTLFGLTAGIAATTLITLLTVRPLNFFAAIFLGLSCILCTILSFDYKARADKDRQNSANVIKTVRQETVEVEVHGRRSI